MQHSLSVSEKTTPKVYSILQILSHGLEINQTLEVLMIGNNPLTTTGCMDLIDAVGAHCTLNVLDIRVSRVSVQTALWRNHAVVLSVALPFAECQCGEKLPTSCDDDTGS